jgi:peptide methionine sulfoxide reductase MsrA
MQTGSRYRFAVSLHDCISYTRTGITCEKVKEDLERSGKFNGRRIVTEIVPASTFYKAEEYHQKYYKKIGGGGSCYI